MANPLVVLLRSTLQAETHPRFYTRIMFSYSSNDVQITALILENTFTNLPRLVPKALPLLGPLSFLCHQKWDSAAKIPLIPRSTPILMLSGVLDEVVPREHMQELWQIASRRQGTKVSDKSDILEIGNGKSKFIEFETGQHSALFYCSD